MSIRKFKKEDTREVALLIKNTYQEFNSQEYFRKSAIRNYLDRYDPNKKSVEDLYKKLSETIIFYVAISKNRVVGMIRGKPDRIVNLFVDKDYHHKGIGKKLVEKFEQEARKDKIKEIKIKSSLYAISFYQKMGYKKTTGIRDCHGLKVCPMRKRFVL